LLKNKNVKAFYKQNMMTFLLDAHQLKVKNTHPELYQQVTIQPVVYDPLDVEGGRKVTEAALTGAFSNYKLYFSINKRTP
jgi:two-component system phosphate regulon sensor histidine kinase PhoR